MPLTERQIAAQLAAHLKERNKYRKDPIDLYYGYTFPLSKMHDPNFTPDYFRK